MVIYCVLVLPVLQKLVILTINDSKIWLKKLLTAVNEEADENERPNAMASSVNKPVQPIPMDNTMANDSQTKTDSALITALDNERNPMCIIMSVWKWTDQYNND